MENMNDIVNKLVEDIDVPEDIPVMYEVWAVGYDEENNITEAEVLLGTFTDPDEAVSLAKDITLPEVVNIAADDQCDITTEIYTISVEVETVVPEEDGSTMNIGTIYKKQIQVYEDTPEFVELTRANYEILEDGNLQIPCSILKDYNKNDEILVIFKDETYEAHPIPYKIISKTTSGHYICEFV